MRAVAKAISFPREIGRQKGAEIGILKYNKTKTVFVHFVNGNRYLCCLETTLLYATYKGPFCKKSFAAMTTGCSRLHKAQLRGINACSLLVLALKGCNTFCVRTPIITQRLRLFSVTYVFLLLGAVSVFTSSREKRCGFLT